MTAKQCRDRSDLWCKHLRAWALAALASTGAVIYAGWRDGVSLSNAVGVVWVAYCVVQFASCCYFAGAWEMLALEYDRLERLRK